MTPRLLVCVHGYPPQASAGAELRAARTASSLAARGLDVCALAFGSRQAGALRRHDQVQDGVRVRRLSGDPVMGQEPFEASYDNRAIGQAVRNALAEWQPHLVYLFSGYLMSSSVVAAARDSGTPAVVNLTDYWWLCHRITLLLNDGSRCAGPSESGCARCLAESRRRWRLPAAAAPALARAFWGAATRVPFCQRGLGVGRVRRRADVLSRSMRDVSAFISPSQYLAGFYVEHGADPGRMHVVRQGVEVGKRQPRIPSEELRFVFAGQVKAHKGVAVLLDAWSMLTGPRPRRLILYGSAAGEEPFGDRVQARVARLPGVEWRGTYGPGEVWRALAGADAVIAPSLWVENSPNIILEAQASGAPVVGSDIGGVAELVRHDHDGLLFRTGDAAALARQLQRLLDDPGLADRLSRNVPPPRSTDTELDETMRVLGRFLPG